MKGLDEMKAVDANDTEYIMGNDGIIKIIEKENTDVKSNSIDDPIIHRRKRTNKENNDFDLDKDNDFDWDTLAELTSGAHKSLENSNQSKSGCGIFMIIAVILILYPVADIFLHVLGNFF